MKSLLNALVILMVFATIACSHKRDMQIDGGLSADAATDTTTEGSNPDEPQANVDAAAEEPQANNSDASDDLNALVGADQDSSGGDADLTASLDDATRDALNAPVSEGTDPAASMQSGELVAQAETTSEQSVPAEAIPSFESAVAASATSGAVKEPKKTLKSPRPRKPAAKTVTPTDSKPSTSEATKPVDAAPMVQNEPVDSAKVAAAVAQEAQEDVMKEALAEQRAQEAGAGITGFLERYVFWVAAGIMGSVIALFFVARRKKADDNFNL